MNFQVHVTLIARLRIHKCCIMFKSQVLIQQMQAQTWWQSVYSGSLELIPKILSVFSDSSMSKGC